MAGNLAEALLTFVVLCTRLSCLQMNVASVRLFLPLLGKGLQIINGNTARELHPVLRH